ncbi:MAG: succinylglutamate desuccinylase/aspartoacylase family protein, partial [Rhodobacteraceae bacterium]|nr:succinylglutamate desuccinylase/aspartoacylase family protein [Paracoccaceae bacterium]
NLNRAFPGDPDGGPTAQIAHLVEAVLLPGCDAAVDLHSGGKASWFHPCALPARAPDGAIDSANMALARA